MVELLFYPTYDLIPVGVDDICCETPPTKQQQSPCAEGSAELEILLPGSNKVLTNANRTPDGRLALPRVGCCKFHSS